MDKFIRGILEKKGYKLEDESINLWGNGSEFFILQNFNTKRFSNFFEDEQINQLISDFQDIKNNKIMKNTSLFLLLNVDNLEEFYKNNLSQIMLIEEDEYYFRKYVIFYTAQGLSKLNLIKDLFDYIQDVDSEGKSLFGKFESHMFFDDAYFIAMQLIIKLPFIMLRHENEQFEMVEDRIKSRIEKQNLNESEQKINQILEILDSEDIKQQLKKKEVLNSLSEIIGEYSYED